MRTYLTRVSQPLARMVVALVCSLLTLSASAAPVVGITSPAHNAGVRAGTALTLGATASDSPETIGKVEFYNGASLIGTATTRPYSISWTPDGGVKTLTAKATNSAGAATTSAPVTLLSYAPPSCYLGISTGTVVTAPGPLVLEAQAMDSIGVTQVEYYSGSILIGSSTATTNPYPFTWNSIPAGSYTLSCKAYDAYGLSATSSAATLIVNAPPTVSLTSPAANQVFTPGSSITVNAMAADSDGTIAKVDFYQGTTLIGTATTAPYRLTWASVPAGSHSLTAKATDNRGAVMISTATRITVAAGGPRVYYIQTDHLGTARLVTDSSNNVVWRNLPTTEPFGNSPPEEDPAGLGTFKLNLRHSGYYFDNETQTFYAYFRDGLDPLTGRFTQSDPIGLAGGSWSTYAFVNGNPISYTDPNGLWPMYGNWGGSNWSGGQSGPNIPANPAPPTNAYDVCDMQHDYCYAAALSSQSSNSCSATPAPTIADCDVQLAHCTLAVPSGTGGWRGSIWGTASGTWAIFKGAGAFGK